MNKELQELKQDLLKKENNCVKEVLDVLLGYEGSVLSITDVQTATVTTAMGIFCKLFVAVVPPDQYAPKLLADILTLFEERVGNLYKLTKKDRRQR